MDESILNGKNIYELKTGKKNRQLFNLKNQLLNIFLNYIREKKKVMPN